MTIATAPTPLSYSGNGSTTAFPITWKYNAKSHIVATLRSTTGTETTWALTTNYTLTDPGDTGTLTAVVAPATGETLVISLEPPNTQSSDIPLGGEFPSVTVEDGLDLAAQRDQKIQSLFDRSLRVPRTDTKTGSALELPIDTSRAGKYLAFDADGDPIASAAAAGTAVVSTFMATVLDDADADAAIETIADGATAETSPAVGDFALISDISANDGRKVTLQNLFNLLLSLNNILTGTVTMSGKSIIEANASIAAHATTMDPWSLGNYVTLTGAAVTFTALTAAPQAGAEVELYMNAAHVFTDGAVFEVDGDANWTAEAGDRVLLRAKSTTVFTVHPRKKTGAAVTSPVSIQAEVATTSGSSVTLASSIPSWVKAISIGFKGVSTNGTAAIKIQLGDAGGLETAGYQGACWGDGAITQLSDGFNIMPTAYVTAADTLSGHIILTRNDTATQRWSCSGGTGRGAGTAASGVVGCKELSAVLTQIALVTTDTFDAGSAAVTFLG